MYECRVWRLCVEGAVGVHQKTGMALAEWLIHREFEVPQNAQRPIKPRRSIAAHEGATLNHIDQY